MREARFSIIFAILCMSFPPVAANTWGRITIPADGLFSFTEGTVEGWVKFEFDPTEEEKGIWRGVGSWFNFECPKTEYDLGASLNSSFGLKNAGRHGEVKSACDMRVGFVVDGREVPHPMLLECTQFGKNEWHHIAVTWKEAKQAKVFMDGEFVGGRDFPEAMIRDVPKGSRFLLGHVGYIDQNALVLDDVRISSIAREEGDLTYHKPGLLVDPFTLLVEDFENIIEKEGKRYTQPRFVANVSLPKEYEIVGGRVTEGKEGQGFAFDWRESKNN